MKATAAHGFELSDRHRSPPGCAQLRRCVAPAPARSAVPSFVSFSLLPRSARRAPGLPYYEAARPHSVPGSSYGRARPVRSLIVLEVELAGTRLSSHAEGKARRLPRLYAGRPSPRTMAAASRSSSLISKNWPARTSLARCVSRDARADGGLVTAKRRVPAAAAVPSRSMSRARPSGTALCEQRARRAGVAATVPSLPARSRKLTSWCPLRRAVRTASSARRSARGELPRRRSARPGRLHAFDQRPVESDREIAPEDLEVALPVTRSGRGLRGSRRR